MDLQALIDLTRGLAGDPKFEGNSTGWEDDEIVLALNWAQNRYAEVTHCTYEETASAAPSDAAGIFTVPAGFIRVERVNIPEMARSAPVATLTVAASAPNNSDVAASVPVQPGASYFWNVAGGTIKTGQGTNAITFTSMAVPGSVATVCCIVSLSGQVATAQSDVALT